MTARKEATLDIKEDLYKEGKCFMSFRESLNPIMEELVNHQIEEQLKIK